MVGRFVLKLGRFGAMAILAKFFMPSWVYLIGDVAAGYCESLL